MERSIRKSLFRFSGKLLRLFRVVAVVATALLIVVLLITWNGSFRKNYQFNFIHGKGSVVTTAKKGYVMVFFTSRRGGITWPAPRIVEMDLADYRVIPIGDPGQY